MNHVCGNVLARVLQCTVRQWFAMCTFLVLLRMDCNPTLALLTIAWLAEFDRDATGAEWFPSKYELSKFIFMPSTSRLARKQADGIEFT